MTYSLKCTKTIYSRIIRHAHFGREKQKQLCKNNVNNIKDGIVVQRIIYLNIDDKKSQLC